MYSTREAELTSNPFLNHDERQISQAISQLAFCNPFLPERVTFEKEILGDAYQDHGQVWHARSTLAANPNIQRIQALANQLAERLRTRLQNGLAPKGEDGDLYRDLVLYLLYQRYEQNFQTLVESDRSGKIIWYRAFLKDFDYFLKSVKMTEPDLPPAIIFACYFQVRRAFHFIFTCIIGRSMAVAELRARIWQSIFTHNMRRYRLGLYERMGDITTLITGPSGTGKELVARALGHTRFMPFDETSLQFKEDFRRSFSALNLSALSPTLLESELFGHRRGAFTGAIADRTGWLESCPKLGAVFLDEIGDLDPAIQVKLLRVLQDRTFQRLGETEPRHFAGKVIAATNRDLGHEMKQRRFREDLYYRLCSDQITTPSLASQLADHEEELRHLVKHIVNQVAGEKFSQTLTDEAVTWIRTNLSPEYSWPGNFRELEQCVRNIMIGGHYKPRGNANQSMAFWDAARAGSLSADSLLQGYCWNVYHKSGSYQATARAISLDRRTVKAKVKAAQEFMPKPST